MPRYNYVLFDADHTLFDFDCAEGRALRQTLTAAGYPADEETCNRYYAINHALWDRFDRGEVRREALVVERFAALLKELGSSGNPVEMNQAYIGNLSRGADLYPGAEALCHTLAAAGCTLAIVTNGVAAAQRGRFAASPLCGIIPHLFISEELGWQKPQREFFDQVLLRMEIADLARTVVVGDNLLSDIGGGRNAGLDTIWYNPQRKIAPHNQAPTWDVADYQTMADIILC